MKQLQRDEQTYEIGSDALNRVPVNRLPITAEIKKLILFYLKCVLENRLKRVDTVLGHALTLPPVWDHKSEVCAGDAVYLRHKQTIRSLTLSVACNADPAGGKVSVGSPIGQALIGRQLGDTVRLDTLDGKLKYEIIKLV
jgi:hypothetical protein